MTIFTKQSILNVWQSSECISGLLKLFCRGSKRDTRERLMYAKLIILFTSNLEFPSYPFNLKKFWKKYSEVIHGSTTFKLIKRLKKKKITVQFDVFKFSFTFFIAMVQTVSDINKSGACYFLHASNSWRVCWRVRVRSHASDGEDCYHFPETWLSGLLANC